MKKYLKILRYNANIKLAYREHCSFINKIHDIYWFGCRNKCGKRENFPTPKYHNNINQPNYLSKKHKPTELPKKWGFSRIFSATKQIKNENWKRNVRGKKTND
jgi:hypothetical protein